MTEPNYQKPPLREEIEAFFQTTKGCYNRNHKYCNIYSYLYRNLYVR